MDLNNIPSAMEEEINRILNKLCVMAIDTQNTDKKFSCLVSYFDMLLSQGLLGKTEEISDVLKRAQDALNLNRKLSVSGTQVVQPTHDIVTNFIFYVCMRKLQGFFIPN
ncbi:MAG: hypothetical protein LBB27_01425 [Tannerellaceae bacterium]|jgi:hypothetical protein|nr:hypothetical protein [Tannerellaceae bacterium]